MPGSVDVTITSTFRRTSSAAMYGHPLGLRFGETAFHHDVLTLQITMLPQALIERCGEMHRGSRSAWMQNADAGDLGRLLRSGREWRKHETESESDREPDQPHGHLV